MAEATQQWSVEVKDARTAADANYPASHRPCHTAPQRGSPVSGM